MAAPTRADYIQVYCTLFDRFEQTHVTAPRRGRPYTYRQRGLIVFFTCMLIKRITEFKAQQRWLTPHPGAAQQFGFTSRPHRTTLSRRYQQLAAPIQAVIAFGGEWVDPVDDPGTSRVLVVDGSLFKARGPGWHQRDRVPHRIPDRLRNRDRAARWGKSGYHGWVYGYRLHLTCNLAGFPKRAQVTSGRVAASSILDQQAASLLRAPCRVVVGDNSLCQALRIRPWAKRGVLVVTPASTWHRGRSARADHRFLKQPDVAHWLTARRTAIEPSCDLLRQVLGPTGQQKQLPVAGLPIVQPFLSLGVLAVQIAMLVNNVWGAPLRQISHLLAAFT